MFCGALEASRVCDECISLIGAGIELGGLGNRLSRDIPSAKRKC